MPSTYNGWTNHSTWCVHLWLSNEEGDYNYWRHQADEARQCAKDDDDDACRILAKTMRDFIENNVPDMSGMFMDLVNSALAEVNWDEIAEAFLEG